MKYQVIVGNVGTVLDTDKVTEARKTFKEYVAQSKTNTGRAGAEDVTVMKDGEPWLEFRGEDVQAAVLLNHLQDIADGVEFPNGSDFMVDEMEASTLLAMLKNPKYYREIEAIADAL